MRAKHTYAKNNYSSKTANKSIFKAILFVLLFSLIFTSVLVSALSGAQSADAASWTGNPTAISSTTSGTNIASKYNGSQASRLGDFYIDSEKDNTKNNFKWWDRGYGFQNYAFEDYAAVYWLEFTFSGDLLTAAQEGRVSYYASAKATFSGDTFEKNDENAMAVSYIGTSNAPTEAVVSSSRSGNDASWASTSLFNSYSGWSNGSTTHSLGDGKYNTTYASKASTTGIRLIFAVIGDGDLHGGFKNLNLTIYVKPKDTIASNTSTFDLTDGLYGENYNIQATTTSNWSTPVKETWDGDMRVFNRVAYDANTTVKYTGSDFKDDIVDFGKLGYASSGLFAGLGDGDEPTVDGYAEFKITLPKGVTRIDFSGKLFAASSSDSPRKPDQAKATLELLKGTTLIKTITADTGRKTDDYKTPHTKSENIEWTNCIINSSPSTSTTELTVRLRLWANHENDRTAFDYDDNGNAFALIGNLKIKMYGAYYVSFNGNGSTSGTMSQQTLQFGVKDSTETLKSNTFTRTDHTFVGWSTVQGGSVVYTNGFDSSDGAKNGTTSVTTTGELYTSWGNELTNKPGATVNLYAVWYESDFGKLSSGTSGKWGSETNPYVISERDHWLSLVDIVNGNRKPVNSVAGTYYGNTISSNDVQASYTSFYNCYFVVTADIELGDIEPVGKDNGISYTSHNFQGKIYGGSGVNAKVNRTLIVNIDTDYTDDANRGTGLFGNLVGNSATNVTKIEYLTVAGNISSTTGKVGGIVGTASSTYAKEINNCTSTVNIKSFTLNTQGQINGFKDGAGGILGYVNAGTKNLKISGCEYRGGSSLLSYTWLDGTTAKSITSSNIIGGNGVGGIVGYMKSGANTLTVEGCSSSGKILGTCNVGGIAGRVETNYTDTNSILFSHHYNEASVEAISSTFTVGGIAGYFYYSGASTTNVVLLMRYCYNQGAVKSGGQSAGGIAGNATVKTDGGGKAQNVKLSYCYNNTANITGTTRGEIVGAGTNTVKHGWAIYVQNSAAANFGVRIGAADKTSMLVIAISSAEPSGGYTRPSDASNTTTYTWKSITNTAVEFNRILLFPSATSIPNGQYLVVRDSANNTITPTYTYNRQTSTTVATPNTYAQNVIIDANTAAKEVAVEKKDIVTTSTSMDKSVMYGNESPAATAWATAGSSSNQFANHVEVHYSTTGSSWSETVKDVYFASGAVQPYKVKILLYNKVSDSTKHLLGVYCPSAAKFTITQRQLTVTTTWNNQKNTAYTYNSMAQGLKKITIGTPLGLLANETFANQFDFTYTNTTASISPTINEGSSTTNGHTVTITLPDSVAAGSYGFSFTKKNHNYSLTVDGKDIAVATTSQSWSWTINKKSLKSEDFLKGDSRVWFGYGGNAVAAGSYTFTVDGVDMFALDMKALGVFFAEANSPYSLVFADSNNVYSNINNYNLYISPIDQSNFGKLVNGTDYTVSITGGQLSGNALTFNFNSTNDPVEVVMTLTATPNGNYVDSRIVRFTVMKSDFGGNYNDANWGSESNPFLIKTSAHLVRLSQIVNGGMAWNSIYNNAECVTPTSSNKVAHNITSRTYKNAEFKVTANVSAKTENGFTIVGTSFDNPFSGSFEGTDETIVINLAISGTGDYTGLFGYTFEARIKNITVEGSVTGVDFVGGIVGRADGTQFEGKIENRASITGRNFVGGIGGRVSSALTGAVNKGAVSGTRAVGGIVGHLSGEASLTSSQNTGSVSFRSDTSTYDDELFLKNGVHFNAIGGLVGFINSNGVHISSCTNTGETSTVTANGARGVGGIVGVVYVENGGAYIGYDNSSKTTTSILNEMNVTGLSYVGGIVGYGYNVTIGSDSVVNGNVTGAGTASQYVGGIAGKWIVTNAEQMPGQRTVRSAIRIDGYSYVGGLIGWLDASNAAGLTLTPFISNNSSSNNITVSGQSYVGALYGGFEGYGYRRSSLTVSKDDTKLLINPGNFATGSGNPYIRVNMTIKSGGQVVGGLIGYASGVGILFLDDYVGSAHTPFTFNGTASFFGSIVGVLGENATIESAKQLDNGVEVGLETHSVRYRNGSGDVELNVNGDFVGSIAGYVASSAGVYISSDTTLMGNHIQFFNENIISAKSYVGGLFGAFGKINTFASSDISLQNLVRYGRYGLTANGPNKTLRYAPSDDGGLGKLFNLQAIEGSGSYVGGIVGYVGDGALLAFKNETVSAASITLKDASTYLSVYNGAGIDPTSGSTATIYGAGYVGGIAGYVSAMSHELNHVVNRMNVLGSSNGSTENGDYVGGIFGYMGGGSVINCIAYSGLNLESATSDAFRGKDYVGGITGMLAGGTISGSVTRGFNVNKTSATKGGIAGSINAGSNIFSSWTIYVKDFSTLSSDEQSRKYASVSANTNGNYVLIDTVAISTLTPYFEELARSVGLFDGAIGAVKASDETYNPIKSGFLSISAFIPKSSYNPSSSVSTNIKKDRQLVFYNVSGLDKSTNNEFDQMGDNINYSSAINWDSLTGANDKVYFRFDMAATQSFSICVIDIEFNSIQKYSGNNTAEAKAAIKKAYRRPASNDARYDMDILSAPAYDNLGNTWVTGVATYEGYGVDPLNPDRKTREIVVLGTLCTKFELGSSEAMAIVISTRGEWNDFARKVRGELQPGEVPVNGYANQFIKLDLKEGEDITVTASNLAGIRNTSSATNVFKGTFDGNGFSIKISVSSSDASALSGMSVFPGAAGATFKNLTIDGNITATGDAFNSTTAENIASFVGKPLGNLTFENCTNLANITANRTAGGIVGFTNGHSITLIGCVNGRRGQNLGRIECNDLDIADYAEYAYGTGGIIGFSSNAITIESCKNEGNITGGYNVGGIVGKTSSTTAIYNCANNGEIFADAHWSSESEYANSKGEGTFRKVYVGGIIGQVGESGSLKMYASYNSGRIVGYGSIVGGLAGSVGSLILADSGNKKDTGKAGAQSVIAYCYNSGDVFSAGENSSYNHRSVGAGIGEIVGVAREQLSGSLVGGIVGFIAWGDINYCYNTGKITTFRLIGYAASWQARIGGIAGQVQPSGTGYTVSFNNCYNLGIVHVVARTENVVGMEDTYLGFSTKINWGGAILGYLDTNELEDRLSYTSCYTVANYFHVQYLNKDGVEQSSKYGKWTSGRMTASDEVTRYIPGVSTLNGVDLTVANFTAYVASNGNLTIDRPIGGYSNAASNNQAASLITGSGQSVATFNGKTNVYNNDAFNNGTAYGYIYPYGCLPQLAVFALDTKEGLSMLSISYGKDDYDNYVGNQAGSKESPYVVKDGVGLLAMSALNGARSTNGGGTAYYDFAGKYIEFADGTNNIESMKASYVNMNMSTADNALKSGTSDGSYGQSGKNYFLWQLGAASGKTTVSYGSSPTSAETLRSNWYGKNNYFNGTTTMTGGSYASNVNLYPIGDGTTPFAGNISGLQGETGNTVVTNLKISLRDGANTYAGMFGAIYDATVANVTVCGSVNGYTTSNSSNYSVFAGGIAGYAGGNSVLRDCQAGMYGATNAMSVSAYSTSTSVAAGTVSKVYAGAIVGAAGPSMPSRLSAEFKTLEIVGSRAANAAVNSISNNIGGIVGYVGNPWKSASASTGRGNVVKISNVYVHNTNIMALDGVNAEAVGTDIGGVLGTNDGDTNLTIDGAYIGKLHPNDTGSASGTTNIYGEKAIGGVIGTANGNTAIGNVEVTKYAYIRRRAYNSVTNAEGLYRTAMGGVVGRAMSNTTNSLQNSIVFAGNIEVKVANASPSDSNPTANIGGIIGAMGSGTRFLSGCVVDVTGTIESNLTQAQFIRNIGGVAGATIDGAFDGTFNVSPTVNAQYATNVGGFIGRNFGVANILASTNGTNVTIDANITGLSQIGGLVGMNGYRYADGTVAGRLQIGADTYLGVRYDGAVKIEITANITASGNDAGGLIGANIASGTDNGLVIRKGTIKNLGTVTGIDNVGGLIGNNEGNITMGGSTVEGAKLDIQNAGSVVGENNIGGVIGYLQRGSIAGRFGNTGSVTGKMFVGGSIGRVDNDAVLMSTANADTYFYNGNEYVAEVTGEAVTVAETTNGKVTGERYVGGSIGGIFGAVRGSNEHNVRFINAGTVNAVDFMGGNIGLLAGSFDYAQFTNSGQINASGSNAIGGSVGFVGILRSDIAANVYQHQDISILNTHFEFVGDNNMSVSGAAVQDTEFEWGGVGGAIGVIGGDNNAFVNDKDSTKWQKVTLYTASGISAPHIYNVGGAIGLIKANYINISNMLAFYTSIEGSKNVGGIVGAATGNNITIKDSFNIEGTVIGNTSGGIVGYAVEGQTLADTSYWVKGYVNAELMALDLTEVVETLGMYIAVSDEQRNNVFTKELTDAYESPSKYDPKNAASMTSNDDWAGYISTFHAKGKEVTEHNGVWAYATGNTDGYTTGKAHTGWYYVYANDRSGLDTTHVSASDNEKPSILPAGERDAELLYWKRIANAYTAEERNTIANDTLTSPIVGQINGDTVTGGGELTQGYIYAAARESQLSGYYLYMDATGLKPEIYYGEPTTWNDKEHNIRPFYLTAKTSLANATDQNAQNVAIYYRSVGIGGTLTYNGYKRYVPITDEIGNSNKDTITYVSSTDDLVDSEEKVGRYVYTMDKVIYNSRVLDLSKEAIVEAGTYLTKVTIYFYDSLGKIGKIGGIGLADKYDTYGELRIEELPLYTDLQFDTSSGNTYNGDNTKGSIKFTVDGIAPLDDGVNVLNNKTRSVKFKISGEKTTNIIDGTLDLGKIMAEMSTKNRTNLTFTAAQMTDSRNLMSFASDKIYLSSVTLSNTSDTDRLSAWNRYCSCIIDKDFDESKNGDDPKPTYKLLVVFDFVQTVEDTFKVELIKTDTGKNYKADVESKPFKIEPRRLRFTLNTTGNNASMGGFNNAEHRTVYYFGKNNGNEGWVEKDKANATTLIQGLEPYILYTGSGQSNAGKTEKIEWKPFGGGINNQNSYFAAEWQQNAIQFILSKMIHEGDYTIGFGKTPVDGKLFTDDGNYYFLVEDLEKSLYQITPTELLLSWSSDNTATYDAQYHYLVASFSPLDPSNNQPQPFGSAAALADEMRTLFPDGNAEAVVEQVSDSLVRVKFRVGPNSGKHTVTLPDESNAHTDNCKITNVKAGEYTINKLDITVGLSGNDEYVYNGGYHRASGIAPSCTVNPAAKPTIASYNQNTGEYILQMFGTNIENDAADNQIKFALSYDGGVAAVNVGSYTAVISENTIRPVSANANFNVTANGQGSLTIIAAEITLQWNSTRTFTYNKQAQGRGLSGNLTKKGDGLTAGTVGYNPQVSTSASLRLTNAFNNSAETLTIPVGGTRSAVNAGSYTASVDLSKITISGKNGAGDAKLTNYIITFANAANGDYTINKRTLDISSISNAVTTKTYDATVAVKENTSNKVGDAVFRDSSVIPSSTNVRVTGVYDSASVGTNKRITYTVTVLDNNYQFSNGTNTKTFTKDGCVIEPRQLTIRLDILRNGYATRTYDGTTWYGGSSGASSTAGMTSAQSATHRSGEGFTVYGVAEAENNNGAVIVKANYLEADANRSDYDAYVNNVVGSGASMAIGNAAYGEEGYFYKNIVFTLSGDSAANYKFVVNISGIGDNICDGDAAGTATNPLTLSAASKVVIEITPYIVRAKYENTAQSYATPDNTYNEDWVDVTGSASGVGGQILPVSVVNNWKYQNNNPATAMPATFKSHTVIRGALNSKVLSARLSNTADGAQVNYRLSNQPILTIGYFVEKDEFEVGSLASLMIATYYFKVSRGEYDDSEFGEIISQAVWELVVSASDYASGNTDKLPSGIIDKDGNEITSWDDYFAWLTTDAGGNINVFLNEYEGENSGWGYYRAEEGSTSRKYDRFKQIANISGVFTAQDLAILNGMFNKVTMDADGNIVPDKSYTWGVGGDFLTNFVKASEGNVVTAIGAVFNGVFDGVYDGNGYTIDGVNIVGIASGSDNSFGMFERIGARNGGASGVVQNVHLRNFSVNVYGEATQVFVGSLAGVSEQTEAFENISAHANITVNTIGETYVGGLFGVSRTRINASIVLGSIDLTASRAYVGGAVGENRGAGTVTDNTVSLTYIWANASANTNIGGIVGNETIDKPTGINVFMANSVYLNGSAISGGTAYSDIYAKSVSGYSVATAYYYVGDDANAKGDYDVLADVRLTRMDGEELSKTNRHESMRLADIIDIYLLMYAKTEQMFEVEGVNVEVFGKTSDSWLVGTAKGTDSAPVKIVNQQGVALLRELRFATFSLENSVNMYLTYTLQTARGAFFGKVIAGGGKAVYIASWDGVQKMFEYEAGTNTPTSILTNGK